MILKSRSKPPGLQNNISHTVRPAQLQIRWRAILFGLVLLPCVVRWSAEVEAIRSYAWPSMLSLPLQVVTILILLVVCNRGIQRIRPHWAFNQGELLVVYVMLAVGSVITGWSFLPQLVGWMIAPLDLASPQEKFETLFTWIYPNWLVPRGNDSLRNFLQGRSSFWIPQNLYPWVLPLCVWTLFLSAFMGAMACISVIMRQRWIDQERLTFPVVQLPFELTRSDVSLLHNRLFQIGFAASSFFALLTCLHSVFPDIPSLPSPLFYLGPQTPPWNAMGNTPSIGFGLPVKLYSWVIGFSMLMPQEVLFSYWFFFWFLRVEELFTAMAGWQPLPDPMFLRKQVAGAMLAIAPAVLWSSRRYLKSVVLWAFQKKGEVRDLEEPIPYRAALIGMIVCLSIMVSIAWKAGLSLWLALAVVGIYFSLTLSVTRARAEIGGPANEVGLIFYNTLFAGVFGTGFFRTRDLALLTLFSWSGTVYGMDPIPHQIEGFKLSQLARFDNRRLFIAIALASVVGVIATFLSLIVPLYRLGAGSATNSFHTFIDGARYSYTELKNWLSIGDTASNRFGFFNMVGGFFFSLFLFWMRSMSSKWLFHPLGFVMAGNWYTYLMWPSIFVAWLIKLVILRYAGRRSYMKALPFFFGLIIGDAVIGTLWMVVTMIWHLPPPYGIWS